MAAIITPRFRKNNAAAFKTALTTDKYYIGIGRAEAWTTDTSPPTPTGGSPLELIQAKTALIQMKKIRATIDGSTGASSVSRMIPRVDWATGRTFKAYAIGDITSIYSSTSGTTTTYPCYCVNANRLYICTTAGSVPVANAPTHTTGSVPGADGYTWAHLFLTTSVSTVLNLSSFISVPDSETETLEKLPSWYVGIGVDINSADLFLDTKYRQVSVVKWPNSLSPDVNIISAKHFVMNPAITPAVGSIITQTGNTARGIVVKVDSTKVYFTQTPNADGTVTAFNSSGNLIINGSGSAPYTSIAETLTSFQVHEKTSLVPDGDIVFLENRQPVTHLSSQVEEVRVVIQF